MNAYVNRLWLCLLLAFSIAGCGGGGGSGDDGDGDSGGPSVLDEELLQVTRTDLSLTGDPAASRGMSPIRPDSDPLVKLGQLLFFSQTLSGGFDSACGTCHHPDFGGGDGLSIGVGVVPQDAAAVGPDRVVDAARDRDPQADGGPNMHRNSMTTFNAALFDRALMFDGRVFVLDEEVVSGGHGQAIRTPESGSVADTADVDGLMEHTMKGPIVNDNEMRGFLYTDLATPVEYREHLVARLRGEVDGQYMQPDSSAAADNWLALFRDAFGDPTGTADDLITMLNVQRALAAYIEASIFVDTPWRAYLDGDLDAVSKDAKKGAMLFFEDEANGGLGCASCHAGDKFSDERFHNVGFPQIGRGFGRADQKDFGRWVQTRRDEHLYAFRTPTLLNVAKTAPYGHAGTFDTLRGVIEYHADPRDAVDRYDFTLQHLDQFLNSGIVYEHAEPHTREAIASESFDVAEAFLPARTLTDTEVRQIEAFLRSLTDRCVADANCIDDWAPKASEDPDGHLLVRNVPSDTPDSIDAESPDDYPQSTELSFPGLAAHSTFADVESCTDNLASGGGGGSSTFTLRTADADFGLNDPHGFSSATWLHANSTQVDPVMSAGGVSAAYLNEDCYPDLVFASGDRDAVGVRFYENLGGVSFQAIEGMLNDDPGGRFTGAAVADLNGDYRRELLFGNLHDGDIPIYAVSGLESYSRIASLPMVRHTFGISFAPLDDGGYPYFYLAHWSNGSGTVGTSPALWKNDGTTLRPWDVHARTTSNHVDQQFNFTPDFADFTDDGRLDLVIASDIQTSNALVNRPDGDGGSVFENVTDFSVITDQNGMGGTVLDRDNDGVLEWFVTSIYTDEDTDAAWGKTGNRLYESIDSGGDMAFADVTDEAGVRDGNWGWGACAADFDNDGFIDLFHVNGFGYVPDYVNSDAVKQEYDRSFGGHFVEKPPRLFMNNGDGTFTDEATTWNIDRPSEGRGVVCFDYDRDGDMDIVLLDHSTGLQFFENDIGHDDGQRFLNIRLVGESPNTDAIGARVHVTADVGNNHGTQTMLRLSEANSNFNSQNPPDLHFGIGSATTADIRVEWPDGGELICDGVTANQFLVLDQRDGQAACPSPSSLSQ